jgi:MiaB-like tRNA modifying enzyme
MRIYLEAHGCSLNRGEAKEMVDGALAAGHSMAARPSSATIIVLDTCVVIQPSENRMLARLRELARYGKPVVVAGCLPAVAPRRVLDACPGAILVGPEKRGTFNGIAAALGNGMEPAKNAAGKRPGRTAGVVEEVPIASGCRGRCTYCIAQKARGGLRSRPGADIMARVKRLTAQGCREIRLTAQDSGLYGLDRGDGQGICGLLSAVCGLGGDFMVRLGMMNPDSLKPAFGDLMDSYAHPRMFKFLHIPVQSGDDGILERMGRNYAPADFLQLAGMFRERFPAGILATDIIVGFPGETEAQFESTLGLLEKSRPDMVNAKAFSPRPGTPAAGFSPVPGRDAVRARMRTLNDLCHRLFAQNSRPLGGTTARVLVTEKARGGVLARTADYRPVLIRKRLGLGAWTIVRLVDVRRGWCVGSPI